MKFKTIKQNKTIINIREFSSINDVVRYISNSPLRKEWDESKCSSVIGSKHFTGTESFDEALHLLQNGWEEGAKDLIDSKVALRSTRSRYKDVFDIQGYQCSVPRYLQGIPTNMIVRKQVPIKNKIITINKQIGYNAYTKKETIIKESKKVLNLINSLEQQGYSINLNVVDSMIDDIAEKGEHKQFIIKVKIKQSTQRSNLKQLAFPLTHPSMLRRICFRIMEIGEEFPIKMLEDGYGVSVYTEKMKEQLRGEYLIPAIIKEDIITDIDKYLIK